jgi:hypothetical protein
MEGSMISSSQISTDALSSCSFLLLIENLQERKIAFLLHSSEIYEPSEIPTTTLEILLNRTYDTIETALIRNPLNPPEEVSLFELKNLQLVVGGGANIQPDFIRAGLNLLNNPNINLEPLHTTSSAKYRSQQLKQHVKILPPITFPLSDAE